MESGIYCIKNLKNDKVYIGSAKKFKIRWKRHRCDLRKNRHCNIILQRSFNKNGKDLKYYKFEILEECEYSKDLIIKRENFYIKRYNAKNRKYGYNIADASFGDNISNHPNRKSIIKKIKISVNETIGKLTKQDRKEKWGRKEKLNGRWDENIKTKKCPICHNDFRRKKICCSSECWKKYLRYNSKKLRSGTANPFYGKAHTDEVKKRLSKMKKGTKGTHNIPFMIGRVKFNTLMEASKKTNIHTTTIRWRLKSTNKKFVDYQYV